MQLWTCWSAFASIQNTGNKVQAVSYSLQTFKLVTSMYYNRKTRRTPERSSRDDWWNIRGNSKHPLPHTKSILAGRYPTENKPALFDNVTKPMNKCPWSRRLVETIMMLLAQFHVVTNDKKSSNSTQNSREVKLHWTLPIHQLEDAINYNYYPWHRHGLPNTHVSRIVFPKSRSPNLRSQSMLLIYVNILKIVNNGRPSWSYYKHMIASMMMAEIKRTAKTHSTLIPTMHFGVWIITIYMNFSRTVYPFRKLFVV